MLPPLPDADGPRLPHFNAAGDREPPVELLELIRSGIHGHVAKTKIDGQVYAVKISHGEDDFVPQRYVDAQCEPFGRECRAFARLQEVGKEHLAVRCYGYLVFDAAMERILAEKLGLVDWGRDPEYFPEFEGRPLQAIVKEFLPRADLSAKDAPGLISDIKEIHRCEMIVADVKYDAYVGTKLVDFSLSITVPHVSFDVRLAELRKRMDEAAEEVGQDREIGRQEA